jgi:hypothetical protein
MEYSYDRGTAYGNLEGERLYFDASKSNSIYGKSDTVQPPAFVVYYIMKII